MRRCGFRSARAQRGLAMVELALTLPLLVLLMLAFAEFGRIDRLEAHGFEEPRGGPDGRLLRLRGESALVCQTGPDRLF